VNFVDIHPLMADANARADLIELFRLHYARAKQLTAVVAMESRGYYIGLPLADAVCEWECIRRCPSLYFSISISSPSLVFQQLGLPFIPLRKPKKLPGEVLGINYGLEYGTDRLEIQKGRLGPDDTVLIVDDLLATGGTAAAACELVRQCGAKVHDCAFVIELHAMNGARRLKDVTYFALIKI
jgi:adenine phosphoribosyltransferase